MSNRERLMQLLDTVPDYKLDLVLAYVQGITADEDADNAFCEQLYKQYLDSNPEDKETVSLEEAAKELGVKL